MKKKFLKIIRLVLIMTLTVIFNCDLLREIPIEIDNELNISRLSIMQGSTLIPDSNGVYDFENVLIGSNKEIIFTIINNTKEDYIISNIVLSNSKFNISQEPASNIQSKGSSNFKIEFKPDNWLSETECFKEAEVSITGNMEEYKFKIFGKADLEVSNQVETYDSNGIYLFQLPVTAKDVTAKIEVIGAGGGGSDTLNFNFPYGDDGAGGGAGQYVIEEDIILTNNVIYSVDVGKGGDAGESLPIFMAGIRNGHDGTGSSFSGSDIIIINADFGCGAIGSISGTGYPDGVTRNGGNNGTDYGCGGYGASSSSNYIAQSGQDGCVIITWSGIK